MYVGINVGSISVKYVKLLDDGSISKYDIINHQGQPNQIIEKMIGQDINSFYGTSGYQGHISEVQAIERALLEIDSKVDIIVSLGGEAFAVYLLKQNKIYNVLSHNRCAAGSGEFLVQQVGRLNLSLKESITKAKTGNSIKIASRCSVHCKSDITHKLNRQEASVEDILYSVHESMVMKIISLLEKSNHQNENLLVIGGLSLNSVIIDILKEKLSSSNILCLPESAYFEAYGTALLTLDDPKYSKPYLNKSSVFNTSDKLLDFDHLVKILDSNGYEEPLDSNELLILGVDGGSTTTKVALFSCPSKQLIASHYTRTNGNPINATKECIEKIISKTENRKIDLIATTGSAREIIAAFLGISAVYNEISAHAEGALAYDPEVDTIFEIGGQDAKYIFIENGSPVDYAMNAACSAGTGSFLEESADGDLGISVYDISDLALSSNNPVNFKADCAAFINSDIRTALQEGYNKSDIVGGLVLSIAKNYLTKVKGPRKVGRKIFFQGGVAKNRSVAHAFAQITGREIIIPQHSELLGAIGVGLIAYSCYKSKKVDLQGKYLNELLFNEMTKQKDFICRSCNNYCTISRYSVGKRKFPFGGKCSKYENQWKNIKSEPEVEDFVDLRNKLILQLNDNNLNQSSNITIGIPRALTTHFLFPLYNTFLKELGFNVILSDIDHGGELIANAPFCFPTQIAHGAVLDLQKKTGSDKIDYVFFPQIMKMPHDSTLNSYLCPITQASPFILQKAFGDVEFLSPTLNFQKGYAIEKNLIDLFRLKFNFDKKRIEAAYKLAINGQLSIEDKMRKLGLDALKSVLASDKIGIILVGRSYNAFPNETSQSIGRKLASKGITTIPFDCLGPQSSSETSWYFSNLILEAVKLASEQDNLFILYISNFGCNIDAFTQEYLRDHMKGKPYLKLDIDSHTADAGTQTRIEAFLEIIKNYRKTVRVTKETSFKSTEILKIKNKYMISDSKNNLVSIDDKRVSFRFPYISKYHGETLAMAMRWLGYQAPPPLELSDTHLNEGLHYTSGNECLPLPMYIGQILEIYRNKKENEIIGFYMIAGGAPCVVASYTDILTKFISDNKLDNIFIFDPHPLNDFYGMSKIGLFKSIPTAISFADILIEIHFALEVIGSEFSTKLLYQYFKKFVLETPTYKDFNNNIPDLINKITEIKLERQFEDHPKVIMTGDFIVRFDPFFFKGLIKKYAKMGIILKPVGLNELLIYPAYDDLSLASGDLGRPTHSKLTLLKATAACFTEPGRKYLESFLSIKYLERSERNIRKKFSKLTMVSEEINDLKGIIQHASTHIDPSIYGESILTVGKTVEAMDSEYSGVILIGPFSCLPFRISESIIKPYCLQNDFPILTYETDGRPIPPSFLRLIDVNIQQILRKWKDKVDGYSFPKFPMLAQ